MAMASGGAPLLEGQSPYIQSDAQGQYADFRGWAAFIGPVEAGRCRAPVYGEKLWAETKLLADPRRSRIGPLHDLRSHGTVIARSAATKQSRERGPIRSAGLYVLTGCSFRLR